MGPPSATKQTSKLPRRSSSKSLIEDSSPLSDNIALDCALNGNVERLKQCFERTKDPYHALVSGMMVKRGAEDGRNALDWSALLGRADIVSLLLSNGAEINAVNCKGYTALHYACAWGRGQCVRALLEGGASTDLRTHENERPIDIAVRYQHGHCVELIELYDTKRQLLEVVQHTKELVASNSKIFSRDEKLTLNSTIKSELDWLVSTESHAAALCDVIRHRKQFDETVQPLLSTKTLQPPPSPGEIVQEKDTRKTSAKQKKK